jgi:MFS transporter, MHS family, proline/betaine transporter
LATSFAFSSLFGVSLYYLIVYASSHLSTTVGLSRSTSLWLCGLALAISLPANSLFGSLSDRIGRRPLALAAAAALSLYAYPLFLILNTANTFLILVALTVLGILVSVAAVMNVVLLVEVFPASTRSSSAALGHNLSLAALAGPSPLIGATLVYVTGDPNAPAWYLSVVSLFCFGILWLILPETHKRDLAQG